MQTQFKIEGSKIYFPFPALEDRDSAWEFIASCNRRLTGIAKRMNLESAVVEGKYETFELLVRFDELSQDASNANVLQQSVATRENRTKTMMENNEGNQPSKPFVWLGGQFDRTETLEYQIDRMRESEEPMGLVLPYTTNNGELNNGELKTIQLGINKASVQMFGFNEKSVEDMRTAIMRDTSDDWHPDDLLYKREQFLYVGSKCFEQVARIKMSWGWWVLIRFSWERVEGTNLVIGQAKVESDPVERVELLR
jgi:hypothetical protein